MTAFYLFSPTRLEQMKLPSLLPYLREQVGGGRRLSLGRPPLGREGMPEAPWLEAAGPDLVCVAGKQDRSCLTLWLLGTSQAVTVHEAHSLEESSLAYNVWADPHGVLDQRTPLLTCLLPQHRCCWRVQKG